MKIIVHVKSKQINLRIVIIYETFVANTRGREPIDYHTTNSNSSWSWFGGHVKTTIARVDITAAGSAVPRTYAHERSESILPRDRKITLLPVPVQFATGSNTGKFQGEGGREIEIM